MFKRTSNYFSSYYNRVLTKKMSSSTVIKSQLANNANNINRLYKIDDVEATLFESSQLITPVDSISSSQSDYNNNNFSNSKIGQALYDHIYEIDHHKCEAGEEDSFFVCNLDEVRQMYNNWCSRLPRVQPFYAIKCNNDPQILKTLIQMGAGFDCASKGEIETMLKMGVEPSRIVYANPCKSNSFIRFANNNGINLTTFDNSDELFKMKKFHPDSKLLLRIITDDEGAQCRLSTKFGASLPDAVELLKLAKELDLQVAGVAFHVGSGSSDPTAIKKAISDSKKIFDVGSSLGFSMEILDIGGGFVQDSFNEIAQVVSESLDDQFSNAEFPSLKIIAEPGRYMCSSAFTLACHVIARRNTVDPSTGKESTMVYLNDGIYGNLNCIIYDHQHPIGKTLTHNGEFFYDDGSDFVHDVSIWGPTCDGLDCISQSTSLKFIPEVGDWIYFENIGAYTSAASTSFNGFKQVSEVKYV